MQSLPAEILDMILNGLDAGGVPFLDPLWRFAARATHSTWRQAIAAAASTESRTHIKAFARAWRVPCSDGRGYAHNCQCAYSPRHGDFKRTLASGRLVSARCAVGRPWVVAWCPKDAVPQQDRAMVALFTLPAPVADVSLVRHLVGPHIEGDESTGPWPVCPLRRDFWCYLERVPPEERGDDSYDPSDSEFLNDALFFASDWNRSDIVRSLLAAYPAIGIVGTVLLYACLHDDAQSVEDALAHVHRLCRDIDDGDATATSHVRGMWKKAAKSGGARVLERFLSLCARDVQRGQRVALDGDKDGRNNGDCTEAGVAQMARLARPKTDLVWQKCAARCGNIDALLVGERYGVPIRVHELIEAASNWGSHKTIQWLLKRVPATPDDPSAAVALVCACESVLSEIVGGVDDFDWTSSAHNQCACRKRHPSKASSSTVDDHNNGQGDQDENNCAPKIRATIDALCSAMLPMMVTDDGIAAARRFLSAYLNRDRHTSDGVHMVVRVIEHWRVSVATRIKPLGWKTLIRAAIATGAVGAINRIVDLIAVEGSSCDLTGVDMWAIATDHLASAVHAAAPPLPFLDCGKCVKRSLVYKRDRAAAMQSHILGVVYGAISVGEAAGQTWRALCRPRPVSVATLGDPARDSVPMASLRTLVQTHGLVPV